MTMDILIFLYLGFIVFKSSVHCQLLTYNIAHMTQLKSSSVLTYGGLNYSTTNVIDGNPATSPDACNCCWSSSDETNPWLEVTLPRHEHLVDIVLQGRTDQTDEPRKLSGLNVQADGIAIPDKWIFVNSTHNFVSIDLQNQPVKSIRINRPKMHDNYGAWFLIVCEVLINIQGMYT
ncbi:uncharacterized protein LOC132713783 [Ruditapes philippinarum]|uniref:uncharacterized protein LOC132713783 n=1 Tax=Ruditapes philippinarum TaxID=129788 RepID=UPI00295AF244|nr:uncharacterized protein LOC132713783 [Ruditapes philippinarum]